MRKLFISLCLLLAYYSNAQNPVQWQFSVKKISEGLYSWSAKAAVNKPWHIYSQSTPEGGPIPTSIAFNKNPMIDLEQQVKEQGKMITKREEVFGVDVKYYDGTVEFVQVFKLKRKIKTNISGTIEYMVCNDSECLPPKKQSFSLAVQ